MLSFVKKVLTLPDICLNTQELRYLHDLIDELPEKNSAHLLEALEQLRQNPSKIGLSPSHYVDVVHYLSLWQQAEVALIKANHNIADTWQQTHHKPISNDELIPLTIDALPQEFNVLLIVLQKIELISMVTQMDMIAFSLANLQAALMTKIFESFNDTLVKKLNQLCDQYLDYLQIKHSSNEPKVIALCDMRITLQRKQQSATHKLEEFWEKYQHHQALFLSKNNLMTKAQRWFKPHIENSYIQQFGLFTQQYEKHRGQNILQFFQTLKVKPTP